MKVAIIGGGAAGLACGALIKNCQVTVFEKNERVGIKLNITGKGRCNFTNDCTVDEFLASVPTNPRFLYSAITAFGPQDTIEFFKSIGLDSVTERGKRVFPASGKALDVTQALYAACKRKGVNFVFDEVKAVKKAENGFTVERDGKAEAFDSVVVACGGVSYPETGSTGFGYKIAKGFGHTIVEPKAALVPLVTAQNVSKIAGLNLKNVQISTKIKNKRYAFFGEVEFYSKGLCGPTVLTLSSYINEQLSAPIEVLLDLKSALSEEKLDERLKRDLSDAKIKTVEDVLKGLLPQKLVQYFATRAGVELTKKSETVTKQERRAILETLKGLSFTVTGLDRIERAIITSGGVSVKEIHPSTMESKIEKGLYFAGEVIDVDALTGGYNLQIAFSTAYLAAKSINERNI